MRRQFVVLGVRPAGDPYKPAGCGGRLVVLRRLDEMEPAAGEEEAVVSNSLFSSGPIRLFSGMGRASN